MDNWNGKGKTSQRPWVGVAMKNETYNDRFGRAFTVSQGCEMRHFETINFGWVVWRDADDKLHIRDVG